VPAKRRRHVTIEGLKREHLSEAVEVVTQAFYDNPLSAALFRKVEPEKRIPKLRRVYRGALNAALLYGKSYIVRRGGRVVAVSIAYGPGQYPLSLPAVALNAVGILSLGPFVSRVYAKQNRHARTQHPQDPHWFIYVLGILPGHQNEGYGAAILNHISRMADADGCVTHLQTPVEEQVGWYQKQGYEVVSETDTPGINGLHFWVMERQPRKRTARKRSTPPKAAK